MTCQGVTPPKMPCDTSQNDGWFDEGLRERLGCSTNEGKSTKAWGAHLGESDSTHLRGHAHPR
jgi:hypothetical protein